MLLSMFFAQRALVGSSHPGITVGLAVTSPGSGVAVITGVTVAFGNSILSVSGPNAEVVMVFDIPVYPAFEADTTITDMFGTTKVTVPELPVLLPSYDPLGSIALT